MAAIEGGMELEAGHMKLLKAMGMAAIVLSLSAIGSLAQGQSTNLVAKNTAWSVFEDESPRECWAVSAPTKTVNTKDGRAVSVKRSDIRLMAFFRPAAGVKGQLAFTGGYPFAKGSSVTVTISGAKFDLFTQGEWAWAASPADDARIIAAMKRGERALLAARSTRGTITKDTFSLIGFTASYEHAERLCAG